VVVDTLVAVGAAFNSDIEKSGLMDLVDSGRVLKVVVYSSPTDLVIKHLQTFPGAYGSVGARGLTYLGPMTRTGHHVQGYDPAPEFATYVTRWFPGFTHSQYWADDWRDATFASVLGDMGLLPTHGS
jgi:hypothetical protein